MTVDPKQLRSGPYQTPRYKVGQKVVCEARGEVTIYRTSNGPIPWPVGKTVSALSLVLYGDLAKAVRQEAVPAIKHWCVGTCTVWKWRKALGVSDTEGNRQIRLAHQTPERITVFVQAVVPTTQDPTRRAKIAAARTGKPRPQHVTEILRQANLGRKASPEARRKMSASHKARGTLPPAAGAPWTADETQLLYLPVRNPLRNNALFCDFHKCFREPHLLIPSPDRSPKRSQPSSNFCDVRLAAARIL